MTTLLTANLCSDHVVAEGEVITAVSITYESSLEGFTEEES